MSTTRIKPKVGIVFSQTDRFSSESFNLANYFCGLLSASGYSEIFMIGYESDGMPGEVYPRRVKYIPRGQTTAKEVPVRQTQLCMQYMLCAITGPVLSVCELGFRCHVRAFPRTARLSLDSFDDEFKRYEVLLREASRDPVKS
jgi:hypothetical protein